MKAWHFTADKLRDGQPIPLIGKKLVHKGDLVMCNRGYHASKKLIDALQYAPGPIVHRVEVSGRILHGDDKLVASERTILWSVHAEDILRKFARKCALDVIHLWDAPEIVIRYLKTGDEDIRDAAEAAAWATARDAARDAAGATARDAWATARDAAWAAEAAAGATAGAAEAAAWATARDAARDAAWDAQNRRLTSMIIHQHRQGGVVHRPLPDETRTE